MKALMDPKKESWGIDYLPELTEGFEKLIESAIGKIQPFINIERSPYTYYFKVKGDDVGSCYDCCDNEKCIKETKSDIRKNYGKGTRVEELCYDNDGDHESIEICCQCGKPLNEWLTWCKSELEYLEGNKPWTGDFLKSEGFLIHCILNSQPTMDEDISGYAKHQGGDILNAALEKRESFFQRIIKLAESVLKLII